MTRSASALAELDGRFERLRSRRAPAGAPAGETAG